MVFASNKEDFNMIKQKFQKLKFDYHTYQTEDDTNKKLVLKGIDISYTAEEICADLKRQYNDVVDVKQMSKRDEKGDKTFIAVYVVYFKWDTRLAVVKKLLQYCCYHRIKWDYFRSKNSNRKVKQCFNCQNFGHHKLGCGLQHRCVKCTDQHSPGKCEKGSSDPQCCNCNGKHPANYQGCPKMQNYKRNDKKAAPKTKSARTPGKSNGFRTPATNNKRRKTPAKETNGIAFRNQQPTNKKLVFADAVKGYVTNNQEHEVNWNGRSTSKPTIRSFPRVSTYVNSDSQSNSGVGSFNFIANEIKSLFGVSFGEMMSTVKAFLPVYKQCHDATERKMLLIDFIFELSK